jgi:hypothetical protein
MGAFDNINRADIEQHDDEDDQHHNRPGIYDQLNCCHKGSIKHNVAGRQAKKGIHQSNGAVHRVFAGYDEDAGTDRDKRYKEKKEDLHR